MNCECPTAFVGKQKAPSLSGRKESFVGHWSESYCPQGRQIGPVKPHCQSDWNWFVVLLLQHPIKRRTLGRSREWGSALTVPVRHRGADGRHGRKWLLALGQLDNAQTSHSSRWNELGWFEGQWRKRLVDAVLRLVKTSEVLSPQKWADLTCPSQSIRRI